MVRAAVAGIRTIDEADATGPLAELYRRLADPTGRVPHILKVQSLSPATLEAHYAFYRALMFGAGPLSRAQRELLAVVVSDTNRCHYWIEHHAASFRRAARDEALADAVHADWSTAPLVPADRALAEYGEALTRDPAAPAGPRLAALREAGFDDEAILRATEIIGYFNFVNRLADGLGVELE